MISLIIVKRLRKETLTKLLLMAAPCKFGVVLGRPLGRASGVKIKVQLAFFD